MRGQVPSAGSDILCRKYIRRQKQSLAKFTSHANTLESLRTEEIRRFTCTLPKAKPKSIQKAKQGGGLMHTFWARQVDILVQSSRNSKWLALSARESERFYARLLSQSELGSPHAVVVAANTLNLIGRSQFLPVS